MVLSAVAERRAGKDGQGPLSRGRLPSQTPNNGCQANYFTRDAGWRMVV